MRLSPALMLCGGAAGRLPPGTYELVLTSRGYVQTRTFEIPRLR